MTNFLGLIFFHLLEGPITRYLSPRGLGSNAIMKCLEKYKTAQMPNFITAVVVGVVVVVNDDIDKNGSRF